MKGAEIQVRDHTSVASSQLWQDISTIMTETAMQPLFIYLWLLSSLRAVWIRVQVNADWGFKPTGQVRLQRANKPPWNKANDWEQNTAWAQVSRGAEIARISLSCSLSAFNPPHSGFSAKQENNARNGHLNEAAEKDQTALGMSKTDT